MNKKVICMNCGRPFQIWNIHDKYVNCPFCNAQGKNPYYVEPKKISPEKEFYPVRDS